jgi:hypothetical protein
MPSYSPPARAPSQPRTRRLAVGTTLYRVHAQAFSATEFNPNAPPAGLGGGRFDSLDGASPYLYAAFSVRTAIAEPLLRGVPFDRRGVREIPAAALRGRCLSELKIVENFRLAALHGEGLSRIGQDAWLVHCDAAEYAATREWGSAIMRWLPSAAGLEWRPRNDDDGLAVSRPCCRPSRGRAFAGPVGGRGAGDCSRCAAGVRRCASTRRHGVVLVVAPRWTGTGAPPAASRDIGTKLT